ncbi:MAG TPA: hypothetical protein VGR47_15740 [Terracidiphilus sp.]|nr:hypothetical protein [Terracidiphilus sp.]
MLRNSSQEQDDFRALDDAILERLTDKEREAAVVYLDMQLKPPGPVSIASIDLQLDTPYVVAFIDRRPGANWMHPCRYLFIDPATRKITSQESDRPPVFGLLPPTWRIVWRAAGVEDWRLFPISRSHS